MHTSHLGDSGIKHKPISKQMQGTNPSKFKPSQQLYLSTHNLLHLRVQFKTNVIMYLPASASFLQCMTLPNKNETDAPVTIKSCKTNKQKKIIQTTFSSNIDKELFRVRLLRSRHYIVHCSKSSDRSCLTSNNFKFDKTFMHALLCIIPHYFMYRKKVMRIKLNIELGKLSTSWCNQFAEFKSYN